MNKKILILILLLIGVHLFLLIDIQFTAWPEMLSYPYLKNNGFLLYKDMIHPYPPVLTLFLAIIYKIFGYKLIILKIVTWAIIISTDVLVYLLALRLSKKEYLAIVSLVTYVLIQPFLEGNMLWFDLAIVPSILFGFLMLLHKKYFFAGLFLAIAALTKQTAAIFMVVSVVYIFSKTKRIKDILSFILGPVILVGILLIRLMTEGAVGGFINWTLLYPFKYWSSFPGYVQMSLSKTQLLIVFLISLPAILLIIKRKFNLLTIYYLCSIVLIYPRFSFFHFQLGIAISAILLSLAFINVKKLLFYLSAYLVLFYLMVIVPVYKTSWGKETRFWSQKEMSDADKIKQVTSGKGKIFLLGPPSSLYVLSERLPPKPWTDNFGWYLEIPGIQEDIIKRWSMNKIEKVFVIERADGNWFDLGTYRPDRIVEWISDKEIKIVKL